MDQPFDNYLLHLATSIADGLGRLPEESRTRHVRYLTNSQNSDGGFSGREGGSDLYYTGFGLRGLAVLDALTPTICGRAGEYLQRCLTQQATVVDFFSLLYSGFLVQLGGGPNVFADSPGDWMERVVQLLETFRTADGGYAKALGSASGSTYHTFLVALCYQLLEKPLPRAQELISFVRSRRREDGGFVEIAPMRRSGTNPTAAAVGTLQMIDPTVCTGELREGVIEFLGEMPSPIEGGLRANARAPLADLLSTFTGIWTLQQLGARDRVEAKEILHFVQELELPNGGFRGGLWDDRTDVEYTFYGLGCLALLAQSSQTQSG